MRRRSLDFLGSAAKKPSWPGRGPVGRDLQVTSGRLTKISTGNKAQQRCIGLKVEKSKADDDEQGFRLWPWLLFFRKSQSESPAVAVDSSMARQEALPYEDGLSSLAAVMQRTRNREGGISNPSDVEPAAGIPQPREPGRASTVPELSDTFVDLPPPMQNILPYTREVRAARQICCPQLAGHTFCCEIGTSEVNSRQQGLRAAQSVTSNKPVASAAGGDSERFQWSEKKGPDVLQARPGMRSYGRPISAQPLLLCLRATQGKSIELDGTGRVQTSENLCWYSTDIGWLGGLAATEENGGVESSLIAGRSRASVILRGIYARWYRRVNRLFLRTPLETASPMEASDTCSPHAMRRAWLQVVR